MNERPDVTIERKGNRLVLTSYAPLIQTVEELLEWTGTSLDEWVIERQYQNAWTTPSKDIEKELQFANGVVSGHIKQTHDMRFAQNIQVKVVLVPKHPEAVYPAIHPVVVEAPFRPVEVEREGSSDFVRSLVWSDPQFGFRRRVRDAKLIEFHNRAVLDVLLQVAQIANIDRIDILGDWFDMSEFTDKFIKSPEFYYTLQPAIEESFWWLQQFARLASTRLHEGNHDKRLPDAIKKHLPFAYGLREAMKDSIVAPAVLSVRNLLSLDAIGVEWVHNYPNDKDWLGPRILLRHEDTSRKGPVETARAVASGYVTEIFGHGHGEEHSVGVREDAAGVYCVEAWTFGCACWTDHRVPGHNMGQNWSNGGGIIDVWPDGHFAVTPISIRNGNAGWNGLRIQARDRLSELRSACSGWNY